MLRDVVVEHKVNGPAFPPYVGQAAQFLSHDYRVGVVRDAFGAA